MYVYKPEFHEVLSGAEDWHFWFRTRRARLLMRYSARELRELLRGTGFIVRRVSYMFPCLFPFIYLARNNPSYNTPDGRVSAGKLANALARVFFFFEDVVLDFVPWPVGTTVLGVGQKPMGQG